MNRLIDHVKQVALDDVRLYFAPFRGAIEALKQELNRPRRECDSMRPERPDRPVKTPGQ
jgi:hypothetical protein